MEQRDDKKWAGWFRAHTVRSCAALATLSLVLFTPTAAGAQAAEPQRNELNVHGLQNLADGFAFYALLFCLAGICISAGLWAVGSRGANPGTELAGKNGLMLCCAAAFFVGATPPWLNYLGELGENPNVDVNGITQLEVPVVNRATGPAAMDSAYQSTAPPTTAIANPTENAGITTTRASEAPDQAVRDLNTEYKKATDAYMALFKNVPPERWGDVDATTEARVKLDRMQQIQADLKARGYEPYIGK